MVARGVGRGMLLYAESGHTQKEFPAYDRFQTNNYAQITPRIQQALPQALKP